jgi:transposase
MTTRHYDLIDFDPIELQRSAEMETEATRRRVRGVIDVSEGRNHREVAEDIGLSAMNVLRMLRAFNENGLAGLKTFKAADSVDMRSDHDAQSVRAVAYDLKDESARRKLMAIVSLYEGDSPSEVARVFGVSLPTLTAWRADFNRRGPGAFVQEFTVSREADIKAGRRHELKNLSEIEPKLTGEGALKAKAIRLSAGGLDIAAVSEEIGRPRSWTVTLIKSYNLGGLAGVFPDFVKGKANRQKPVLQTVALKLPKEHSVKSLRDLAATATSNAVKENLEALASVYLYRSIVEASENTGIAKSRLSSLLNTLRTKGVDGVMNRERIEDVDADKVDALASDHKDPRTAAKLRGLARIVRGEGYDDIASELGVGVQSVRNWMAGLRKYGIDFFTDGNLSVPAKPKAKVAAEPTKEAAAVDKKPEARAEPHTAAARPGLSSRVVRLVASNETAAVEAAGKTREENRTIEPTSLDDIPFVPPQTLSILGLMARDENYQGRKLACAVQAYVKSGNAPFAAAQFDVREASVRTVFANLQMTVEMYAESRVKDRIAQAGITPTAVRRMAANPPSGWMSKLRSIGYLAEGKSLREVSALTHVDAAKLVAWTDELAGAWAQAKEMAANGGRPQAVVTAYRR